MTMIAELNQSELPAFDVTGPSSKPPCSSSILFDAVPFQHPVLRVLESDLCPKSRCNDVDRAIMGASLGG